MEDPKITTLPAEKTRLFTGIEAIKEELSKIETLTSSPWTTSGNFRWNPGYLGNDPINIHKSKSIGALLSIDAYIRVKHEEYVKSAEMRNLKSYPVFTWLEYTYNQWKHDLDIRIAVISQKDRVDQLTADKKELEQFLDKEDRMSILLDKMGL